MSYCSNCGENVDEGDRFCKGCGRGLGPPDRRQAPTEEGLTTPTLDDVPAWLGWLGIPMGLTVIGLVLYCYWAYRRGRRDGVGRRPTEEPYQNFGWRVSGWAAVAVLLPIVDWYVFVHLPTLCYKHGLRVGAKEKTAFQGFASLPALGAAFGGAIVAAFAALFAVGLALWIAEGEDGAQPVRVVPTRTRPAPTPSGPLLTGAEAAGKASAHWLDALLESDRRDISVFCDAEDYNSRTHTWIVLCSLVGPANTW
jgi:hypothetical protein